VKKYRTCENKKTGRTRGNLKPQQIGQLLASWKPLQEKRHHDSITTRNT
jgi:hypothetical protein